MVFDLGERERESVWDIHTPPPPQNQQTHRNNEDIKSPCKEHPCVDNYTGARCEAILLPSIKSHPRGELFVAVLASVVVLSVLVAGAFFFLCRLRRSEVCEDAERDIRVNSILGN
ncbi:Pro-neuregulin-4, membrane-bound isoform [Ophiophagus hannah]|uniref:Pro-neuregulin-4, membrane-bound isoform n=1 Tax=Ophiophagus hannah TaxID=8665 RepID=V8NXG7_OPHHA|nr:Pro-neuregulin-4, membrane-bound isoform [Ophiophagus hannah]